MASLLLGIGAVGGLIAYANSGSMMHPSMRPRPKELKDPEVPEAVVFAPAYQRKFKNENTASPHWSLRQILNHIFHQSQVVVADHQSADTERLRSYGL